MSEQDYRGIISKMVETKFKSPITMKVLLFFINREEELKSKEKFHITLQTIGDAIGFNRSRIYASMNELKDLGYIEISKRGRLNVYKFIV